jgi:hypothetical protein
MLIDDADAADADTTTRFFTSKSFRYNVAFWFDSVSVRI